MKTIRRYLWLEIASASLFVLFALLSLFLFFDMVNSTRSADGFHSATRSLRRTDAAVAYLRASRLQR